MYNINIFVEKMLFFYICAKSHFRKISNLNY